MRQLSCLRTTSRAATVGWTMRNPRAPPEQNPQARETPLDSQQRRPDAFDNKSLPVKSTFPPSIDGVQSPHFSPVTAERCDVAREERVER